jgi:predicted MPP superfamily phosphohydrolase
MMEALLGLAYAGSWPARLWRRVPGSTRVRLVHHVLPLLPPGMPPLRLAFASDLHLGPTTPVETLESAFALLRQLQPDVLALGGDYVFLEATTAKAGALARLVASVPARLKLAVLGNHDLWTEHPLLERALAGAGAHVLVDEALALPPPHHGVCILGLDDPWTGGCDVERALSACPEQALKLAVCHAPEALPRVVGRGISLLVCGHTHGGQVASPWGPLPRVVSGPVSRLHPSGLYTVDDLHLFVSRGVGGVEVPVRLFAPPDVALLELVPRHR